MSRRVANFDVEKNHIYVIIGNFLEHNSSLRS